MDDHFHAVVQCEELARVMADLKKFIGHRLLAQFETEQRNWLVDLLAKVKAAHKHRRQFSGVAGGVPSPSDLLGLDHDSEDRLCACESGAAGLGGLAGALAVFVGA